VIEGLEVSMADRYCRSENVVGRNIAGEYILVPIVRKAVELDSIYNLNPVGAFIWERLDGCASGEEIVRRLVERFEVSETQAALDYSVFLAQLESIKVVKRIQEAFLDEERGE